MSFITTKTGKHFRFEDINLDAICIEDIACSLSNLCRFTGHVPNFYSVAQHSVLTSYIVPSEHAFEALMHDAAEAYCNDIAAPLKALLPDYRGIEARIDLAIRVKFGLPHEMTDEVKKADMVLLATERRDFGLDDGTEWHCLKNIEAGAFLISPLEPREALAYFMFRFNELKGHQHA